MSDNEIGIQSVGLGKRLKSLRETLELTQGAMGDILGVDNSYVSALENGREEPSRRFIKQIASQFHVREEWLDGGLPPMALPMEDLMKPVLKAIQYNGPLALEEVRAILSTVDPSEAAHLLAEDSDDGDPYLALAKEVRDKIQPLATDIENAEGLACLDNCTDGADLPLAIWLNRARKYVAQAALDMNAAVQLLEERAKAGGQT